jgi:hypothetical protein
MYYDINSFFQNQRDQLFFVLKITLSLTTDVFYCVDHRPNI